MDKSAIKNFAVSARVKLKEQIEQKSYTFGITKNEIKTVEMFEDAFEVNGNKYNKSLLKHRESLVKKINEKGFDEVIEEVAYTWFNRLIAIRFMEVNEYLPTGVRVLSSTDSSKVEPDIIRDAANLDFENLNIDLIYKLQDENNTEELFKYLLIKQCNELGKIMPVVFEEIEDFTELLLPDNLLQEGSIIRDLVTSITEEDFKEQVEIIGWLYQYYISEKKDEVFADLKKNIKITKENIPAATQLFTPDWIVKYMVENSLGRLWLEKLKIESGELKVENIELKEKWKYYLEEAEQEPEVQKQLEEIREKNKNLKPEDIKFLDPCMGSGHILVYAFDVLYDIYKSAGYPEREIPKLILTKNLYGLEIDDRAAQLAYFAVMMKARSYNRRIFREKIDLNICSIQESNFDNGELRIENGEFEKLVQYFCNLNSNLNDKLKSGFEYLINVFNDAKEYGSILEVKEIDFDAIERRIEEIRNGDTTDLFELQYKNAILEKMPELVKQGKIMSRQYDVVCTNPPYMGSKGLNDKLSSFINNNYPDSKMDIYSVFIEKCSKYAKNNKYVAMITQHSWMFLTSFENLRTKILNFNNITSMVHLGSRAFEEIGGEIVQTVSFVIRNSYIEKFQGVYIKLLEYNNANKKEKSFFELNNYYYIRQSELLKIPGYPIAYWVSNKVTNIFSENGNLGDIAEVKEGMTTGNNDKFLRMWYEVCINKLELNFIDNDVSAQKGMKWFPYNKGGKYRKWYGNNNYVIDWFDHGRNVISSKNSIIRNRGYYFKEGISWVFTGSDSFCARSISKGFIFDVNGKTAFIENNIFNYILGLLISKVSNLFLKIINPTISFQVGDIKRIPVILNKNYYEILDSVCNECVKISKKDWDNFEVSWGFNKHPLIVYRRSSNVIEEVFNNWASSTDEQFNELRVYEEKINTIFLKIYNLENELVSHVDDKDITISKADRVRDIKSFISYAVGCMLGRYSLDEEGLIYAGGKWEDKWRIDNGEWTIKKSVKDSDGNIIDYNWNKVTFAPDADNVIPITDDEYFEDDIVNRFVEFVKITFSEETLEENLDYIADTLGKKGNETSRQTIRRYFLKDFYKDHLQTYQKRPIYWLFDSGKNDGFKALIYMHRYDIGTVARVRTDYLHLLQRKYEAEVNRLDVTIESSASAREKAEAKKKKEKIQKQIRECIQYDQVIAHVANQKISMDLDEGVVVNYAKFQGVEVPQGEGKKALKADLLAKI